MGFDFANATQAAAKKHIAEMLATNDAWLYRGLVAIYNRQTEDEKDSQSTKHENGKGFAGMDAQFGTDMAKQYLNFVAGKSTFRYPFSPGQHAAVRKMMKKYAGQLAKVAIATEKAKAAIEADAAQDEYECEQAAYDRGLQRYEERMADLHRHPEMV